MGRTWEEQATANAKAYAQYRSIQSNSPYEAVRDHERMQEKLSKMTRVGSDDFANRKVSEKPFIGSVHAEGEDVHGLRGSLPPPHVAGWRLMSSPAGRRLARVARGQLCSQLCSHVGSLLGSHVCAASSAALPALIYPSTPSPAHYFSSQSLLPGFPDTSAARWMDFSSSACRQRPFEIKK